jgi:uncharacterized protein
VIKFLLLAIILYGIYFIFFKKKRSISNEDEELMIECEKCGVYVSKKEAIISNGKYYCSKECLR